MAISIGMPARRRRPLLPWSAAGVCLLAAAGCAVIAPVRDARTGVLQIGSNPGGARIIIDGTATNFRTPTAVPGVPAGTRRVLLSLAGHRNWEGEVVVTPGATNRLAAVLAPVATGRLGVTSIPEDAEVLLDGEPAKLLTPAELGGVPVGTHTVRLQRDGYENWSQAVVIIPDRHLRVQAVLTPSRKDWGHLRVQSHPTRARIAIDGYPTGKTTPETVYNIQAGNHRVELTAEGHRPWSGAVTVREGRTEDLLVRLQPLPVRELGGARIESDPPGAAISLGGVLLRQQTPANLEYLAIGTAALELTLPGHRPWRGQLQIAPGEVAHLSVTLAPEMPYGGSLRVESDPPGAAIALDGQPTGATTPALLPHISAASHQVTLSLPGHRDCVRTVAVPVGATGEVKARLVRAAHQITARVVDVRGENVELEFFVRNEQGAPEEGTLALFLASNATWQTRPAKVALAGGAARVQIHLASATGEALLTVGAEGDRASFRLRRAAGGWEISPEE